MSLMLMVTKKDGKIIGHELREIADVQQELSNLRQLFSGLRDNPFALYAMNHPEADYEVYVLGEPAITGGEG